MAVEGDLHNIAREYSSQAPENDHLPDCSTEGKNGSGNSNASQCNYHHWFPPKSISGCSPYYHQAHLCYGE
jgi:hypothetical protein